MAAKPNGDPFIDIINFGSHYCAMYRWDDTDKWTIIADKKRSRLIFGTAAQAQTETKRILLARRRIRAEEVCKPDPLGTTAWRANREAEVSKERTAVFGGGRPKIVFGPHGQVQVEYRRPRA